VSANVQGNLSGFQQQLRHGVRALAVFVPL
jgi:hypothetical protein